VNNPAQLHRVLGVLGGIKADFDAAHGGKAVSLADLLVLAGNAAVEKAARDAGVDVEVPFHPGRTDATPDQTDVESFGYLEPAADGFRNYQGPLAMASGLPAEHLLIDKANLLTLSAPEMTVLIGGLRVLGANWDGAAYGVFTDRPGVLTNDFFVNLLDLGTTWTPLDPGSHAFVGVKDGSGEQVGVGTRVDLLFGSNSELRALAEVYASDDAAEKFVRDFAAAWGRVTELDRFDLHA
jgi:catalase-peroxidase